MYIFVTIKKTGHEFEERSRRCMGEVGGRKVKWEIM